METDEVEVLDSPIEDVIVQEVIVCWRCELDNDIATKICVHCEASLKVGKSKGSAKKPGMATKKILVTPLSSTNQGPPPNGSLTEEVPVPPVAILPEESNGSDALVEKPPLDPNLASSILERGLVQPPPPPPKKVGPANAKKSKGGIQVSTRAKKKTAVGSSHLLAALGGYALMLAVSIAFALISLLAHRFDWENPESLMGLVELLDTLVVLWLVFYCKVGPFGGTRKVFGWLMAIPSFLSLMCGNILFSEWRNQSLGFGERSTDREPEPINFFNIVTTSIQPGVIEELYCRHILQGVLLKLTGPHAAIWVSGAMFALLHIFNPLGLPYLFLVGVVLGYLRYWSGSLALVMVLHALHNFGVMLMGYFL